MSRPLHRGVSGGGRLSGNSYDLENDSQMKDRTDHTHSTSILPFRFPFSDNSTPKQGLTENGFTSDSYCTGTSRSRHNLILLFLKYSLVVIVILGISLSFWLTMSITTSSRGQILRGYRRLQEKLVSDLRDIGELSLGPSRLKEFELCSQEFENYVPCYNISENLALGFSEGEENERHCGLGSRHNCLVLPPVNYKTPLRWPMGTDVIWVANVKITAQEVLSSGSLTKR